MTDSKPKVAVEASTSKTTKTQVGQVVRLGVKVTGGSGRPVFRVAGQDRALYAARDESTGAWVASWIPSRAGTHEARVEVPGADPVTFTIIAAPLED